MRWILLLVALALTLYAVVDCAMTNVRTRAFGKPVWLVLIVVLPVVGPLLWLFAGKNPAAPVTRGRQGASEFLPSLGDDRHDARIRELEEEMRKLDEEIEQSRRTSMGQHPASGTGEIPQPGDSAGDGAAERAGEDTAGGDEPGEPGSNAR